MSPLPAHLATARHWDWPWPFSKIPRKWTAFDWGEPELLWGNTTNFKECAPKPIPYPGEWAIFEFPDAPWWMMWAAWGVAVTLKSGRHFRFGARWDDVDNYCQFPSVAVRKFPPSGERDTSTH